jgi:hypothetical protein
MAEDGAEVEQVGGRLNAWNLDVAMDMAVVRARRRRIRQRITIKSGSDAYGDYRFEIADG